MENIDFSIFEVFSIQHCLNIIAACFFFFVMGKFIMFLGHFVYELILEINDYRKMIQIKIKEIKQRKAHNG